MLRCGDVASDGPPGELSTSSGPRPGGGGGNGGGGGIVAKLVGCEVGVGTLALGRGAGLRKVEFLSGRGGGADPGTLCAGLADEIRKDMEAGA